MPIFKIFLQDHRQLIKAMEDIVGIFTPPYFIETNKPLKELFYIFSNQFTHYHLAANKILYPVLQTYSYLESRILKAYQFHEIIQNGISQLSVLPEKNKFWEAKFMVIRDIFLLHLQEEDNVIFPVANELLSPIEKTTLIKKIQKQRSNFHVLFVDLLKNNLN